MGFLFCYTFANYDFSHSKSTFFYRSDCLLIAPLAVMAGYARKSVSDHIIQHWQALNTHRSRYSFQCVPPFFNAFIDISHPLRWSLAATFLPDETNQFYGNSVVLYKTWVFFEPTEMTCQRVPSMYGGRAPLFQPPRPRRIPRESSLKCTGINYFSRGRNYFCGVLILDLVGTSNLPPPKYLRTVGDSSDVRWSFWNNCDLQEATLQENEISTERNYVVGSFFGSQGAQGEESSSRQKSFLCQVSYEIPTGEVRIWTTFMLWDSGHALYLL